MTFDKNNSELNRKKGLDAFAVSDYVLALKYFFLALADDPRNTELWVFAGVSLYKQVRLHQAKSCLEFALEISPNDPVAVNLYSGVLSQLGDHENAIKYAERAVELRPNDSGTWKNRAFAIASSTNDRQKIKDVYSEWGRRFSDPIFECSAPAEVVNIDPNKKLKIGYVSGDLRSHSVAFFISPYLKNHDKNNFEIYVYSTLFEDEISNELKNYVDTWQHVQNWSDSDLLRKIREDSIDILVDLSGHTAGNRLDVFSMRAAPIQVTWLGFMYTLGMKAIDYRLTDAGMDPVGAEQYYVESLFRLNCMATYVPPVYLPEPEYVPADRNGYVTMVSLNHTRKINDDLLKIWCEILVENPNSGLLIIAHESSEDEARENLVPRLLNFDFPMDRVTIRPKLPLDEFMRISEVADFALDSFPVSGGTTTLHSLWMGLPVVALNDESAASSSSAKTLIGVGLSECVAGCISDYKRITSELIGDPNRIRALRHFTRPAMKNSVLMDYNARVRELESAYRVMWRRFVHDVN